MIGHFFHHRAYAFFSHDSGFVQDVKEKNGDVFEEFEFKKLTQDDFPQCSMIFENGRLFPFQRRLQDGHHFFGFQDKKTQKIVAYFWLTGSEHMQQQAPVHLDFWLIVPPRDFYIWDCRVHPDVQNKGLYTAGLRMLLAQYKGFRIWITSETGNKASLKGIKKSGFKKRDVCHFARILNYKVGYGGQRIKIQGDKIFLPMQDAD